MIEYIDITRLCMGIHFGPILMKRRCLFNQRNIKCIYSKYASLSEALTFCQLLDNKRIPQRKKCDFLLVIYSPISFYVLITTEPLSGKGLLKWLVQLEIWSSNVWWGRISHFTPSKYFLNGFATCIVVMYKINLSIGHLSRYSVKVRFKHISCSV